MIFINILFYFNRKIYWLFFSLMHLKYVICFYFFSFILMIYFFFDQKLFDWFAKNYIPTNDIFCCTKTHHYFQADLSFICALLGGDSGYINIFDCYLRRTALFIKLNCIIFVHFLGTTMAVLLNGSEKWTLLKKK